MIENWNDAADDAYSYLMEKGRTYDTKKTMAVIDLMSTHVNISQDQLLGTIRKPDFVATVLSLVTMAIHRKGAVPPLPLGWYGRDKVLGHYSTNPKFAEAWRAKRRLATLSNK
ncbi:hypothetical protein AYO42_04945 [Rhizomicrobium sp. SCGC AG-212-E05]|nr:hypothetical protein AYO42_04945 [Rhizomicrobium sp. SCGC AG-212-E05]